jgi:HEAT repeat protein
MIGLVLRPRGVRRALYAPIAIVLAVAISLCAPSLACAQDQQSPDDSLYYAAVESLNRGAFEQAAREFERVTRGDKSSHKNESRYWQAYALYRLNDSPQTLRTALKLLEQQKKKYPDSPVASDVNDLYSRIRGQLAARGDGDAAYSIIKDVNSDVSCGENAEVRMAALQALQNVQGVDILPTLRAILSERSECTKQLRERAVQLLSVRPISETEPLVVIAANDPDEGIRTRAVPMLAQATSNEAVKVMGKVLNSGQASSQEVLLGALGYNPNPAARRLLKDFIGRPDGDEGLKSRALNSLVTASCDRRWYNNRVGVSVGGYRHDVNNADTMTTEGRRALVRENSTYLRELYGSVESPALKEQIVGAIVRMGGKQNTEWLLTVAENPRDSISVRRTALYATGVINNNGGRGSRSRYASCQDPQNNGAPSDTTVFPIDRLINLYAKLDDTDLRQQLLYVYAQRAPKEDVALRKLVDVARKDPNIELRRRAVVWISQMKTEKAAKALSDIISVSPN